MSGQPSLNSLSGASAVSHDSYATVIKKGNADSASELRMSRINTLGYPKGSTLFPYTSPALFSMTIGFVGMGAFFGPFQPIYRTRL